MDTNTIKFGYSWSAYKSIEEDMMRVTEHVPLETRQYGVYSFKLTDIIIRSCSHMDSLFKNIIRNQDLSDHPNQQKVTKAKGILAKDGMLKIRDYIEIFAEYLNLAPIEIIIRRNNDRRRPFKEFENPDLKCKTPLWWDAYNALKHDFYSEVGKGTLENALLSLSALFVLNCQSAWKLRLQENIDYLVLNRVITSPNFIHTGDLLNYIKKDPTLEKYSLLAQTDLFEYWLSYNRETIGLTHINKLTVPERLRIPGGEDMFD